MLCEKIELYAVYMVFVLKQFYECDNYGQHTTEGKIKHINKLSLLIQKLVYLTTIDIYSIKKQEFYLVHIYIGRNSCIKKQKITLGEEKIKI